MNDNHLILGATLIVV